MNVREIMEQDKDSDYYKAWLNIFPEELWTENQHAYMGKVQEKRQERYAVGWTKVLANMNKRKTIDINKAHEFHGHVSNGPLQASLASQGYTVKHT